MSSVIFDWLEPIRSALLTSGPFSGNRNTSLDRVLALLVPRNFGSERRGLGSVFYSQLARDTTIRSAYSILTLVDWLIDRPSARKHGGDEEGRRDGEESQKGGWRDEEQTFWGVTFLVGRAWSVCRDSVELRVNNSPSLSLQMNEWSGGVKKKKRTQWEHTSWHSRLHFRHLVIFFCCLKRNLLFSLLWLARRCHAGRHAYTSFPSRALSTTRRRPTLPVVEHQRRAGK